MNPDTIADIAFELFSALKKQKMIQPLTDRYLDIDINDAYQISKKFLSHREIEGEKVIGKKIGVRIIDNIDKLSRYGTIEYPTIDSHFCKSHINVFDFF